jgi:preprotein translocase subunit SecG
MELALIIAFLAFCLTLIVLSFTQNKTDKKVDKKNIILQRIIAQGGIAPDDLRNIKKVKGL